MTNNNSISPVEPPHALNAPLNIDDARRLAGQLVMVRITVTRMDDDLAHFYARIISAPFACSATT
jgi:hypothetical protein